MKRKSKLATPKLPQILFAQAKEAREHAHAPYSEFRVGCAISDDRGEIHTGCNVENASYPAGLCAEAVALGKMVVSGGKKVAALAVVTSSELPVLPCGICRQMLVEFSKSAVIYAFNQRGTRCVKISLAKLLPSNLAGDEVRKHSHR